MKILRRIVPLLLIASLTMTGIPLLYQQVDTRDGAVDLRDAILQVTRLTEQASDSGSMRFTMANTLTALRVAAELETVIAADDASCALSLSGRSGSYLPTGGSEYTELPSLERPVVFCESFYSSVTPDRIDRPPRA